MKIEWLPRDRLDPARVAANREYCRKAGFPSLGDRPPPSRVAVVGGSHSVNRFIHELKAFDGEIWAVNGAFQWCRAMGIDAVFFRVDAKPLPRGMVIGARRAVVADYVDPSTTDALVSEKTNVRVSDKGRAGNTAACQAVEMLAETGVEQISYYGTDSSFEGMTHNYKNDELERVFVECGGRIFQTCPYMIMQAEWLAEWERLKPERIMIKGDGFLPALCVHGDYQIVGLSPVLAGRVSGITRDTVDMTLSLIEKARGGAEWTDDDNAAMDDLPDILKFPVLDAIDTAINAET